MTGVEKDELSDTNTNRNMHERDNDNYQPETPLNIGVGTAHIVLAILIFVALFMIATLNNHNQDSTRWIIYITLVIDIMFCLSMFISGTQALGHAAIGI
jgi:hypothetical protein